MEVTDLGPTQLKNIERPIRAYSLQVGVQAQAKPAKPAEPVTPAAPTPQQRRFGRAPLAAALAALLVVIAGGAWWVLNANRPASGTANAPEQAARLSIVVLPFANLSGDPAQDYLIDALTDELTTSLARMRDTFVIAHNTAMTFKGKPIDVKAIGKDLGVRYVLEGSVQPSGDRMRVNAQLIDSGSGAHLWAEQFDTPRADLLQTQDAIVTRLTRALDLQLNEAEAARLKRTPAANRDAEDLALQCDAGTRKAGFIGKEADAAYGLCEQALAIDSNNVRALMVLSGKFFVPAAIGVSSDPKGDLERADEFVSKALTLDPDYAWAHSNKGNILQFQGHAEEAVAEHERALAIDPANVFNVGMLGIDYEFLGDFDKSFEYFDKAIRASPYDPGLPYWYGNKAQANFGLKRYDQAIDWARRAIATKPDYNNFSHMNSCGCARLNQPRRGSARGAAAVPRAALRRAAQDDRGMEGAPDVHRRGPSLRRDERPSVRRPAQSRNAGGVRGRDSGEAASMRGRVFRLGETYFAFGTAGYGADSGPSRAVTPVGPPSAQLRRPRPRSAMSA